ncbi:MAG: hypothetical protein CMI29_10070 [Opitutae bacterium]|nr:hypothetical protein [Opitutae bacterium]
MGKVDYKDLINKPVITSSSFPAPQAADAGKIVTVNSTGDNLVYSQRKIDFTELKEAVQREIATTEWWEVFGPTNALAVCSGIVPQTLTSKMHIQVVLHLSGGTTNAYFQGILTRNVHVGTSNSFRSNTDIGVNTDSGFNNALKVSFAQKSTFEHVGQANLYIENVSFAFVDDLSSSDVQVGDKVTYSVKVRNRNDLDAVTPIDNTIRINRFGATPNNFNYPLTVSTLTVTEY